MDYKKIYCDKWRSAYTSNTINEVDGNIVELRWKNVPLGELFCGPTGVVFTKLYKFMGDPDVIKIQAFPAAEKEFNTLLKNVEKLEYICQLYEHVETNDLNIYLYRNQQVYGQITFYNGEAGFEGRTNEGWKTSKNPETLITHAKWLKDRARDLELMDDMDLIGELGSMLKR